MRFRLALLLAAALGAQQLCGAQDAAPPELTSELIPDLTAVLTDEAAAQLAPPPPEPALPERGIYWEGWKQLAPNILRDQKKVWLFPVSVARGEHLKPTLAIVGVTAGLIALDKHSAGYFNRTHSFDGFNRAFSGRNTALATEIIPAALYVTGLFRKDIYAQETFFLAARAVISSEILTTVMKDIDRREIGPNGNYSDTWFDKTHGNWFRGVGSFPSGHTIAAFAVATVYADRYPNPRWRRWLVFGLAGLVGFSRASLLTHYAADVFAGAALGYAIAHYGVLGRR